MRWCEGYLSPLRLFMRVRCCLGSLPPNWRARVGLPFAYSRAGGWALVVWQHVGNTILDIAGKLIHAYFGFTNQLRSCLCARAEGNWYTYFEGVDASTCSELCGVA